MPCGAFVVDGSRDAAHALAFFEDDGTDAGLLEDGSFRLLVGIWRIVGQRFRLQRWGWAGRLGNY